MANRGATHPVITITDGCEVFDQYERGLDTGPAPAFQRRLP